MPCQTSVRNQLLGLAGRDVGPGPCNRPSTDELGLALRDGRGVVIAAAARSWAQSSRHLGGGLDVVAAAVELGAGWCRRALARGDADQGVVGVGVPGCCSKSRWWPAAGCPLTTQCRRSSRTRRRSRCRGPSARGRRCRARTCPAARRPRDRLVPLAQREPALDGAAGAAGADDEACCTRREASCPCGASGSSPEAGARGEPEEVACTLGAQPTSSYVGGAAGDVALSPSSAASPYLHRISLALAAPGAGGDVNPDADDRLFFRACGPWTSFSKAPCRLPWSVIADRPACPGRSPGRTAVEQRGPVEHGVSVDVQVGQKESWEPLNHRRRASSS